MHNTRLYKKIPECLSVLKSTRRTPRIFDTAPHNDDISEDTNITILEEMYESNLFNPAKTDDMGEDFQNAVNSIVNAENELLNKFPDCKDILEEYQSAESDMHHISQRCNFCNGFKAGAQLIMEIFNICG